jgi:hypothetical protein
MKKHNCAFRFGIIYGMAKQTTERRIISHIENAYSLDLHDGKEKVIVLKMSPGLQVNDMGYVYSAIADINKIFGCITFVADDKISAVDVTMWADYISNLHDKELEGIRDLVAQTIKDREQMVKIQQMQERHKEFMFLDLRKD